MSEQHVTPDLLAYLDNELSADVRTRLEAHVQTCPDCAAELDRLQTLRQHIHTTTQHAMGTVHLPHTADERIRQRLDAHQRGGAWWAAVSAPMEAGRQLWRWRALATYAAMALLILAFLLPTWQTAQMPTHGPRQETIVLGQTVFTPGTQAALRVLVRDPDTNQPTPNADIAIKLAPKRTPGLASLVWQGKTDAYGTAQVTFSVPDMLAQDSSHQIGSQISNQINEPNREQTRNRTDGQAKAPINTQAESQADLIIETHSNLGDSQVSQPITIRRSYKLYLSSDKPLYQPGQVIHMRALAMGAADRKPAAGQEIEFVVSDAAGNKVFRRKALASSFGIAAADFTLASEIIQGDYRLEASLGDTLSEKSVQVRPYVLPKFKVSLQAERAFYRPGEAVKGHLLAEYFFGKPTDQAQVTLRGYTRDVERRQVLELKGQTDADGRFEFEFLAPDYMVTSSANKAIAYLEMEAEVRDQAEHTENGYATLPVTDQAILVDAIPESGLLKPGVENVIYLLASYPDGRPAQADLNIQTESSLSHVHTGEYGLGELRLTAPQQQVTLNINAQDKSGASGEASITLKAETSPETILLRAERAAYRVGDTLKLEVLTSGNEGAVYLDIIRESQSLATHALPVENGQAKLALDLDENYLGTLELNAYRILHDGGMVRDTRLIVVDTPNEVNIAITSDREVYRPGDTANLEFQTRLGDQAVPSALGIGIVDESVFALAEQEPGFERLYFLLEKEMLEPRYEVHGFNLPTLLSPKTTADIKQAQDESARAAWAGLPGSRFTLQLKALLDKSKEYLEARLGRLKNIADWLTRAVTLLPIMLVILVIWGLRPTGVLGQAIGRLSILLTALILTSPISLPIVGVVLWVGGMIFGPLALAPALLGWLIAWGLLCLYAWRQADPRAQLAVGLTSTYLVMGGLLVYVAEAGADIPTMAIVGVMLACLLAIGSLLVLGIGFLIEGTRLPGLASIAMGLLIVPITFYLAWLPGQHSLLVRSMGNVRLYAAAGNLLTGCGVKAPQTQTVEQTVAKEAAGKAEPTKEPQPTLAPQSTRPPTATPVVGESPAEAEAKSGQAAAQKPPRLRQFFPETLFWLPEADTDANGYLALQVPIADSITTWRLTAIANTQDGRIGAATHGLRVFQDFFIDLDLPVALTQGDEVRVPVAIYNYLTQTQHVRLELQTEDWFSLMGQAKQELDIAAQDIQVAYFPIRAEQHGRQRLTVTAWGSHMSDAIAKEVNVVPNGSEVREGVSARLGQGTTLQVPIPANIVTGTARIQVKLYAGAAAQAVEGLDALLRQPHGCFEQTSSTLYPDIMVLDYLNQTNKLKDQPELGMKAEQFIATGYQRLLTFEVEGQGFSLFGDPPASLMHTAYGLMEFSDMARVYPVDAAVIQRTARWLLSQQAADGSWDPYQMGYSHFETWQRLANARLPITAYITWALVEAGYQQDPGINQARAYLMQHLDEADDPYVLALVANALAALDPYSREANTVLGRLASAAIVDGDTATWQSQVASYTGAQGHTASLETSALATYALLRAGRHTELAQQGLNALIEAKDTFGTWETTQATVLALKAFLLSAQVGGDTPIEASVDVALDDHSTQQINFDAGNTGVVQTIFFDDVTPGNHTLRLQTSGDTSGLLYQVTHVYYVPWGAKPAEPQTSGGSDLTIQVNYDRSTLALDEMAGVQVEINYDQAGAAPWVIVDLGVPPGFNVVTEDLDELVKQSASLATHIKRYEMTGRSVILYLENLSGTVRFNYRIKARLVVRAQVPASTTYDYYNPSTQDIQAPGSIEVIE